jgi:hypothetical protein
VAGFAVVARLRPGAEDRATELLAAGPPFDPAEGGIERHMAYVSAGEVVFVFEGDDIEWGLDELVALPALASTFIAWRPLIDGPPRVAREVYRFEE